MITIIHGSNQLATRNQLLFLKKQYQEIVTLDGENLDQAMFHQSLESKSLFAQDRLVIVEGLLGTRTSKEWLLEYLAKNVIATDLIFWEDHETKSKEILELSKKAKIINLNLPTLIFKFLDTLSPTTQSQSLQLFNQLIESDSCEIVFFMMIRQLRYLMLLKTETSDGPVDYNRLMPWQKIKLSKQAELFTRESLVRIYKTLLNIDYKIKTGQTNVSLEDRLRLFFLNLNLWRT